MKSAAILRSLVLAVLFGCLEQVAEADSFRSPASFTYYSQDSTYALRTIPGDSWRKPQRGASALVLRKDMNGSYSEVRQFELVNPVSPVTALISNDGQHVVTFDDWYSFGWGGNAVVIYDRDDSVIKQYAAEDFIPAKWLHKTSVSTRRWGKGHRIDEQEGQIVLNIFGADDSVRVDLKSGRIVSPDWAIFPPLPRHHPNAIWEQQFERDDSSYSECISMFQPEDTSAIIVLGGMVRSGPVPTCDLTLQIQSFQQASKQYQWKEEYLRAHTIRPRSICRLNDGGYAVALRAWSGCKQDPSSFNRVMRFTSGGELVWSCSVGSSVDSDPYSIIQSQDGSLLVAGREDAPKDKPLIGRATAHRLFLQRISAKSQLLWSHEIPNVPSEVTCALAETAERNLILAYNHSVTCWNERGDSLWSVTLKPIITSITSTGRSSLAVIGYGPAPAVDSSYYENGTYVVLASREPSPAQLYFGIISYHGQVLSETYIGQSERSLQGKDVTLTSDGGFMIGGTSTSGSSLSDAYLIEIDSGGDSLRSWTFGSPLGDDINKVQEISPGHFAASGNYAGTPFMFEFTSP